MNKLIEAWRECEVDKHSVVFVADNPQGVAYDSYASFIESNDFGSDSSAFHLGLIPQPYIGNISTAKVFLLMLNPGFSPGDYYAQEQSAFRAARIANLHQKNSQDKYPFLYLNPAFAWTAGGQWWQRKLNSVARELMKHEKLSSQQHPYRAALRHISQHLACIELCPYFSKEYKQPKMPLASVEAARAYVREVVAAKCRNGEALAVMMRQVKQWPLDAGQHVISFSAGQARGAHLTVETDEAGKAKAGYRIYEKLAALL